VCHASDVGNSGQTLKKGPSMKGGHRVEPITERHKGTKKKKAGFKAIKKKIKRKTSDKSMLGEKRKRTVNKGP